MGARIRELIGRQILDSRGEPTVEVDVVLDSGARGRAAVPAGASTGRFEAQELRDGAPAYLGEGVLTAISNVQEIGPQLTGRDVEGQSAIDQFLIHLDATPDKSRLGANAILAISLAVARAASEDAGVPLYQWLGGESASTLPVPMLNVINGGVHAPNALDFQEFMIVPAGAESFADALRLAAEVFQTLKGLLRDRHVSTSVGDEGGFAPDFDWPETAIEAILDAIERAGHSDRVALALDPAASELFRDGSYRLQGEEELSADAMIDRYQDLLQQYPIVSLEDGLAEDDWDGWRRLTSRLGDCQQLVGDDIFVTNPERLERAISQGVANAILVKPNQIGTLTETLQTIELASRNDYATVISHRSGETTDTTIADLAVATNAGQIKAGAPSRGERVAKYNRLLRIEEELGEDALYEGWKPFQRFRRESSLRA